MLVCRSSEIDFDAIWANLGGKIAIESPEKLLIYGIESLEELPFRCVDRCYLHVLYVSIISTVLKTGTLKTPRGGECPPPPPRPPLKETLASSESDNHSQDYCLTSLGNNTEECTIKKLITPHRPGGEV